ncbi:MAG TPA: dTDP-4-dehydrorhamnose reductase [Gammaproteobacteria bacterium]|nr:dTDP-4-dehydrorhamnose reductase [Gammaproteobacteria bacterium]
MKVLITGAHGQLGRSLQQAAPDGYELVALDRSRLDISDNIAVTAAVEEAKPDVVINAAAYTAVDRAESEREQAYAVNAIGSKNLAQAAAKYDARLIHISTDFVFDGQSAQPYRPDDATNPLGVYGHSKLEGEREVAGSGLDRWLIVRTSWVYAAQGSNFVSTMLRLMNERDQVNVVCDQAGTPTWARSLAHTLWKAVANDDLRGIYHWSDAGTASWYDFAVAIQEEALQHGLLSRSAGIAPIRSELYPTAAKRPRFSVLDKTNTYEDFDLNAIHWRVNLRAAMLEIAHA